MSDEERKELIEQKTSIIYTALLKDMAKKLDNMSSIGRDGTVSSSVSLTSDKTDIEVLSMLKRGGNLLGLRIKGYIGEQRTVYSISARINSKGHKVLNFTDYKK